MTQAIYILTLILGVINVDIIYLIKLTMHFKCNPENYLGRNLSHFVFFCSFGITKKNEILD